MTRRVVVFDLGMVLSSPDGLYEELGSILGVTPQQVLDAFWLHRHAYDEGMSDQEFWSRTLGHLGVGPLTEDLLAGLVSADVHGWDDPRPGARAILADLTAAGVETAVLSNAPTTFALAAPEFDWYDQIGTWFFSGTLGVAKPDQGIYAAVESGLAAAFGELWFIDDKQVNVDAANERGWHAHLWVDDDDTRAWLVAEGFLTA